MAADPEFLAPEVADVPALVDPDPAYVTGSSVDLPAWNDAAARLFRGAVDSPNPSLVMGVPRPDGTRRAAAPADDSSGRRAAGRSAGRHGTRSPRSGQSPASR